MTADAHASSFIPLCTPQIEGNEWAYIKECLDTGWVSSVGSFVDRFEKEMAIRAGVRHGVATVNGTSALHMSLLVAGIQPGDEVITSSLTFIAPANAIRYAGAWPVFIDADPVYWQMDVGCVEEFLSEGCRTEVGRLVNRRTGRRVAAVLPVHVLGHPVDMDPLMELARCHGLVVIEDATESLGALYKGRPVGSVGDIACFSFNGNKVITTGGGGMMVTSNGEWAQRAKYLTTQAKDDPVEYVHEAIGYNYRLTNIQAAMGCAQLEQLDKYVAKKRRISETYEAAFKHVAGLGWMKEASWAKSIYWMATAVVDPEPFGMDSRALLKRLGESRVQARPLWRPIHMNTPYRQPGQGPLPVSEQLYASAISLPCSVGLTPEEQQRVISLVRAAAKSAAASP